MAKNCKIIWQPEWSLKALDEDVEVFIGVANVISVDKPVEFIFDEDIDCTTANEEFEFYKKFQGEYIPLKLLIKRSFLDFEI